MHNRLNRRITIFLVAVLAIAAASAVPTAVGGEGGEAVTLGRQFGAMPWLAELGDAPYEIVRYNTLPVAERIPASGLYYEIDSDVVASAYSYFFYVRSPDAEYVVGSVANLAKLVHELGVIEEIKKRNKGKEVVTGVADGVKGIGSGLVNLVVHPGLSLKSAGTRVRQTGRSIERAVGAEDSIGRDQSGVDRSHLGRGPAGAARRAFAAELGVDVYTSNPVLRSAIVEVSQLQTVGSLATWVIPYHIGMIAYLNPISGDEKTETRIRDFEPSELRRLIGKDLEPLFSMDREDKNRPLGRLLENPNYSPREIAYIARDFEVLAGVANLGLALEGLAGAETPEEADMLTLELRLYSFFHRTQQPLSSFIAFRSIYAGVGADGVVYLMAPLDTLRPWKHTTDAFAVIVEEALAMRARGLQVWTIGDVDPSMVNYAASHGVVVRQNILRDPGFVPERPRPAGSATAP